MNIEKISVDGYYVWVDKDVTLNSSVGERNGFQYDYRYDVYYYKSYKIVAASSELNLNISALNKVPTYVEWLAKQEVGWWDKNDDRDVMNFIKGYQTAEKEKSDELLTKYQEGFAKALKLCNGSDFIYEVERNRAIGFAKWISCSYSFGDISGLWHFHENTSKQYTEEELYELYLEQFK